MTADFVDTPPPRRRRPVLRGALVVAILLLAALLIAWSQRKTIASDYIDKMLAERHVPARYRIADLGFDRQRLTNVVIGDPAHPDLVADWIELRTAVGLSGPEVKGVRAGRVRMRARLIDGRLSLGAIDKLLPAPSGKPFALPAIFADIPDARIRLETPQGIVGLKLSGRGKLDDGFRGQLAAISERLDLGGCTARRMIAALAVRIDRAKPVSTGPVRAAAIDCGGVTMADAGADVSLALSAALDRWDGSAKVAVGSLRAPDGQVRDLAGTVSAAGSAADMAGAADLKSGGFVTRQAHGDALAIAGRYRVQGGGMAFQGRAGARRTALAPAMLARLKAARSIGNGTPVGPLVERLASASAAAASAADLHADLAVIVSGGRGRLTVSRLVLASMSGARVTLGGGKGVLVGWPDGGVMLDGTLWAGGGGLPGMRVQLAQRAAGAPINGTAIVQPYEAGTARLALTPIRFGAAPGGATRFATRIALSGPLGNGRIDNLVLPVAGLWDGGARLAIDPACAPLAFDRLAVSGLVLRPARLALCPIDGAMVRIFGGKLGGGARIAASRLSGTLGSTPVALAMSGAELTLADQRFALRGVGVRLGATERMTRFDFDTIDGGVTGGDVAGRFTGGGGQIANVPLVMSQAGGTWAFNGAGLGATGAMTVSDAAADPRFKPLAARNVAIGLANGKIGVGGTLYEPSRNVKVADVAIGHVLASGEGAAAIKVSGIAFSKDFQPDLLTRLTFGVIADVNGTVSGEGHIRWSPAAVTSDGVFRTAGTDLAAAFGPVTGLATEIRFTDLLALQSAPGQVATVKTLNPGIPVNDGTIRYQTLPGARVQVESGDWPFAGGALVLEPTLLDFGEAQQRRMTFRVIGMAADQFLQQFDFKNLDATGIFDGVLPMVFDADGGRIEGGHLTVRQGGGTIAYVGEVSQKDVGFWGNLAFQSLKSLRYKSLNIVMNGPLAGEMVTEVRFAGVGQGAGTKRNFLLDRLQKLPLIFNVTIKAPFRQLIDSAQSFYDPRRLIARNLPALLDEQNKRAKPPAPTPPPAPQPIQPSESRKMP